MRNFVKRHIRSLAAWNLAALLALCSFSEPLLYAAQNEVKDEAQDEAQDETQNEASGQEPAEARTDEENTETASELEEAATEQDGSEEETTEGGTTEEETTEGETTEGETTEGETSEGETTEEETAEEAATDEEEEEPEYVCPEELEPENVPYDENQDEFTERLLNGQSAESGLFQSYNSSGEDEEEDLPESYDARDEGYLPAVRNQGSWGACWSFSLIGAMEVSMVRDMDVSTDDADLSERHLAYFAYNTGCDVLENADDDTMTHTPERYYLTHGGNDMKGVVRLMNWNGGASEEDYPYDEDELPDALERTDAQDAQIYLENAYSYNFSGASDKSDAIKVVKQMITDYGAVSWSYYHSSEYLNSDTGAYYNDSNSSSTNHAIMAVGWDDTYSKENFNEDRQPESDGAWIIRNSWGESGGDGGYYYISYEDVSLGSGNPVYAFTVCDSSKYDNNYFWGNTAYAGASIAVRRVAQVYQLKSENAVREKLTAVSFLIGTSAVDYELQIYKNPDMEDGVVTDPTSGTAMLDEAQTGTTGYTGLYTIELDTPVELDVDDYVAIVLTFPDTKPYLYFDRSYTATSSDGSCEGVHTGASGESFYSSGLTSWTDGFDYDRTFRINALTVDCDDVVETPEIKSISATDAQGFDDYPTVTIRWTKCTDVDGYRIYRSEDGENYELIADTDSTVRTFTDMISERKTAEYFYRVDAVYGDTANASDAVSKTVDGTVSAPDFELSSYDGYEAVLEWESVDGAEGYELWYLPLDGEEYVQLAEYASDDELSYTADTSDWELGYYYYRVRAKQGDEYSDWGEACVNRDLVWSRVSYTSAYFEWLSVDGAATYKLRHRVNGSLYGLPTTTAASMTASVNSSSGSYLPCDEHQYYVTAYDEDGNSIYTSSTIVFCITPDAVSLDGAEYDYAQALVLSFSAGSGSGVDEVEIYRSDDTESEGEQIACVDASDGSYTDTVAKGKTYYYSLTSVAIDSNGGRVEGETAQSEELSTFPEAALLTEAQYTVGEGVSLAWETAAGAEGYYIERAEADGEFALLAEADVDATDYADESVEAGNLYRYCVLSCYTDEDGELQTVEAASVTQVKALPAPVAFSKVSELAREDDMTRVALSWEQEDGRVYSIYRSAVSDSEAESYECIAEGLSQGEYTDSTAEPDTCYGYKLIVTINGLSSELDDTTAFTITTKPVLLALTATSGYIELVRDAYAELEIVPEPADYPAEGELVWSACDSEGNALTLTEKNDTTVIFGADGKEICYFSDNKIYAVCASETAIVTLTAAIGEISAECTVFVYIDGFWVTGVRDLTYTGAALTQSLAVYDRNLLLTEGEDYTVSYKNNVKVSADVTEQSKKPAVIVKGKGSYTGSQTLYFEILAESDEDAAKVSIAKARVKSIAAVYYDGEAAQPKPVVSLGGSTLTEGEDYTLSYENNTAPGKAAVIITGTNGYKGQKRVSFQIKYNMESDESALMSVSFDESEVPYAKGGSKPGIKVYCKGTLLTEGTDYTLSYKNNKAVADASDVKAPTVVIRGKGSYKGTISEKFSIVRQDIGNLTLTAKDRLYTGKAGSHVTGFTITDTDGKKLSAGKDYDKTSVTCTDAETGEEILKTDIVQPGTTLRITVAAAEDGAYYGTVSGDYRVSAYGIGKAKAAVSAQTYTGSAIEPDSLTGLTVLYKGEELTEGEAYEITGYENNVKKGTAKLYIRGKGDFCGTKTVKFKIKTRVFQWWWQ